MDDNPLLDCKMFAGSCVDFYWKVNTKIINSDEAILSEMLDFRKQPVFRLSFRNGRETQVVSFSSINLCVTGIRLLFVSLKFNKENPVVMTAKRFRDPRVETFSLNIPDRLEGTASLRFRVYIKGTVENYDYNQTDDLLNTQLWSAVLQRRSTDVELVIGGGGATADRVFPAHRSILAARSPFFRAKFEENQSDQTLHIGDADSVIFEQLLRFIYTGERPETLGKPLAALAARYQIETLVNLCENCNENAPKVEDIPILLMSLRPVKPAATPLIRPGHYVGEQVSSMPLTELRFIWRVNQVPSKDFEATHAFIYNHEKAFHVGVHSGANDREMALYFFSTHHHQLGYDIIDIQASVIDTDSSKPHRTIKLERFHQGPSSMTVEMYQSTVALTQAPYSFTIQVTITSILPHYTFQPSDKNMKTQLWSAFLNHQLTDVELVLHQDVIAAHRVVLVSRSPVFQALLGSEPANQGSYRSRIQIDGTHQRAVFEDFLYFLYTGTMQGTTDYHRLLVLAEKYQVDTLKHVCQCAATKKAAVGDISAVIMLAN